MAVLWHVTFKLPASSFFPLSPAAALHQRPMGFAGAHHCSQDASNIKQTKSEEELSVRILLFVVNCY